MKYLIINADDFGKYESVNEGIIEGVNAGVITSTSLMVYADYIADVSAIIANEQISIGLHFIVPEDKSKVIDEFYKQIKRFEEIAGRKPDHIDSHLTRLHQLPTLSKILNNYAKENKTPMRDMEYANFIDDFFALDRQTYKNVDFEKISPRALISILENDLVEGFNELMCHPGRISNETINKKYGKAREVELESLLSPEFNNYINTHQDIELVSWNKVVIHQTFLTHHP